MGEITVILVLALIFIGPKKLPELASGLGRLIREIRKTTADVKNELQLDEAIRKPFQELRDAVTLPPEELKRRDRIRRELEEMERHAAEEAARVAALPAEGTPADASETILGPGAGGGTGGADLGESPVDPAAPMALPGDSNAALALAAVPTDEGSTPVLAGVPPVGTVARGASGKLPPPTPLFPPAAPGASGTERKIPMSASSELLRALRGEGRKPTYPGLGAADSSNTTQILSDADLAQVAATPPPPPPPDAPHLSGRVASAAAPPSPVRLPGSTPSKTPSSST